MKEQLFNVDTKKESKVFDDYEAADRYYESLNEAAFFWEYTEEDEVKLVKSKPFH